MFTHKGKVCGMKGFMTFNALENTLRASNLVDEEDRVTDALALTFHFRLATHGSKSPQNTHPFPVSENLKDLKAIEWEADYGVAHNGVLDVDDIPEDCSDTQAYISQALCEYDLDDQEDLMDIRVETAGSRLFILKGDGSYTLTGEWSRNSQGVLYSNLHWWNPSPKKSAPKKSAPKMGVGEFMAKRNPLVHKAAQKETLNPNLGQEAKRRAGYVRDVQLWLKEFGATTEKSKGEVIRALRLALQGRIVVPTTAQGWHWAHAGELYQDAARELTGAVRSFCEWVSNHRHQGEVIKYIRWLCY